MTTSDLACMLAAYQHKEKMMPRFFAILAGLYLCVAGTVFAQETKLSQEEAEERVALARKAVALSDPQKTLDSIKDNLQGANPALLQILDAVDIEKIRKSATWLMAKHFTTPELRAMVLFYNTPEGQSITEKMPIYQQEVGKVLQQEIMANMQALMPQQGQGGGFPGRQQQRLPGGIPFR